MSKLTWQKCIVSSSTCAPKIFFKYMEIFRRPLYVSLAVYIFSYSFNNPSLHVQSHTQKKIPRKNSFHVYRQQEIYRIFKTYNTIPVLFAMKCHLFQNCAFFCSSNANDFINHALKFKHTPQSDKV